MEKEKKNGGYNLNVINLPPFLSEREGVTNNTWLFLKPSIAAKQI